MSQRQSLVDTLGVMDIREQAPERYDKIDDIIVVSTNLRALAKSAFGEWKVTQTYAPGNYLVLHSSEGFSGDELTALVTNPAVKYVEPNYRYRLAESSPTPNDPYFQNKSQWGLDEIGAPTAWTGVTGSNIIVAVVDSGIDYTHEDIVSNLWSDPGSGVGSGPQACGFDFVKSIADPMDTLGHGTHCAGIIGAVGNNARGIAGICWHVKIMGLKVFAADRTASEREVVPAIDFAITNHANIINLSLSRPGGSSDALEAALQRAADHGLLIVVAAGNVMNNNDTRPFYPACSPNPSLISVLAVNEDESIYDSSNYGHNSVHIGAPGTQIFSTVPTNGYAIDSGTSMAAAYVSGAAALIWSHPNWKSAKAAQIRNLILGNAKPVPSLAESCVSGGILNISFLGQHVVGPAVKRTPVKASIQTHPPTVKDVYATGYIDFPVFAIGGETTGIQLKTESVDSMPTSTTYEIDLGDDTRLKALVNQLAGKKVEVRGVASTVNGVEIPERHIIKVEDLTVPSP